MFSVSAGNVDLTSIVAKIHQGNMHFMHLTLRHVYCYRYICCYGNQYLFIVYRYIWADAWSVAMETRLSME